MESLANSSQRMVYLVTYSRADTTKFSSKESFSLAILEAWQHFGIRILHWVVCTEAHSSKNGCVSGDNINMNLYHFHYYGCKIIEEREMASIEKLLEMEVWNPSQL